MEPQALAAGRYITEHTVQILPCVEVVLVDRNECPCAPESGCMWLKTKVKIPRPIRIISVNDIIAQDSFSFLKWDRFKYIKHSRVNSLKKRRYYTMRDSGEGTFLYVYNDDFLESISISAIFEDPMDAAAYPKCGKRDIEAVCNPMDVDLYLDGKSRDTV